LLALGFAAGAIAWSRTHSSALLSLPTVEQVTFRWGAVRGARFAPDGRVFYSATFEGRPEEVFTRPVGSAMSQPLGLPSARLLAVSGTGELAVLLAPRFSVLYTARGTLARVPGVGGTPREVAENVEYADWSADGALALVTVRGTARVLEFPPGKALFRTEGWLSDLRVSRRGDLIAFIHHPLFADSMGEVMVIDPQGSTRTLSSRYASIQGLAWAPGDQEIWFTSGELQRNVIRAVDLEGRARDVYRTPSDLHLDDIAADGSVLVRNQFERNEVQTVDSEGHQVLLSWTDWANSTAAVSRDRKVLFSVASPVITQTGVQPSLAVLRSVDGSPAQVLGEGEAVDLSPDGRWALVRTIANDALEALPTGPGQPQRYPLVGFTVRSARWMPDGKRIVFAGRVAGGPFELFELDPDRGPPRRVSEQVTLGGWPAFSVSPDGQLVAALDGEERVVIVSLSDGKPRRIPGLPPGAWPRGWAASRQLWFTQGADLPTATRLFRVDIESGKVLEERTFGPPDPTGASSLAFVQVTGEGRDVAYIFNRFLGHLYILRGLPGRSR
jgi:hypothetical protein